MDDYISREAAYQFFKDQLEEETGAYSRGRNAGLRVAMSAVMNNDAIPAADVRPVVLCRDCKWCHAGYCEKYDDLIPFGCANKPWEDWFCTDGKKREES